MTSAEINLPAIDAVLTAPFWDEPRRVIAASFAGSAIRIQAVGVHSGQYRDVTLTAEQFANLTTTDAGDSYQFNADPALFRLATEALRTTLAHSFDPQFAVSVSQVDPLPHQLDAVYRHLLPLPRIRFLLADDPGAGKTIMAGLLMRELMQRGDVCRVLVLCPKALTDQWRREMLERFRENFTLLTGDIISNAFGQNAWSETDLAVASIDLAIQDHIKPGLLQSEWDLIIFDEAHKLSAYRYGKGRVRRTQRYSIAEELSKRTRHMLLMTATPHKGDDENFRLLLALLDPTVFATQAGMRRALDRERSPYFLRRMKESMQHFDGRPLFLPRDVSTVTYELSPPEQELYDTVTDYIANGLERAELSSNRNVGLALTVLQRRLASSLYAITRSLERRHARLSDELEQARASGRFTQRERTLSFDPDDDEWDDLTEQDEDALSAASNAQSIQELEAEIGMLDDLVQLARRTMQSGREKKLDEFMKVVEDQTVSDRNEKVLVFSEHKDTVDYITRSLRERGYSVCNIHGGMKLQDRIEAEKEFKGPTQFMVATDAAGEGINLQFCRVMMNWDLPWNPNRLEQRMGRIHRYGQQSDVQIFNLVAETTREGMVLARLMDKLRNMKDMLGHDQVYDVISGVLDGGNVRLDALIRDAILNRRSIDEILGEFDFVESESARAAAREALAEGLATSHIDLAFLAGEERESKERRLTPEFVEGFFVDALTYLGGKIEPGKDQDWRLEPLPANLRRTVRAFNIGDLGKQRQLITFYKDRVKRDPPAEFLAPDHPIFDAVAHEILSTGRQALTQGTVLVDKDTHESYLIWLLEVAATNGQDQTVHRRLLALRQRGDRFDRLSAGAVLDLLPRKPVQSAPDDVRGWANSERAIQEATGMYTDEYMTEVQAEQRRQVEVMEQALEQSVSDNLNRLSENLERQMADKERGKDMDLAIRTTNQQIDRVREERAARVRQLQLQREVMLQTPRIVGVAAVVPDQSVPVPETVARGSGGDMSSIDRAAMDVVLKYETSQGREPRDVSRERVGYDIKSVGPDGEVRYIEVKGHARAGDFELTY